MWLHGQYRSSAVFLKSTDCETFRNSGIKKNPKKPLFLAAYFELQKVEKTPDEKIRILGIVCDVKKVRESVRLGGGNGGKRGKTGVKSVKRKFKPLFYQIVSSTQ